MRGSRLLRALLIVSGLVAAGIGAALLFAPAGFHATNGIDLGTDASLLSEVRAPGGFLLTCGILMLAGAFVTRLTFTSAVVASMLFLSYGLARLVSLVLDGWPAEGLVVAAAVELALGAACAAALGRALPGDRTGRPPSAEQHRPALALRDVR